MDDDRAELGGEHRQCGGDYVLKWRGEGPPFGVVGNHVGDVSEALLESLAQVGDMAIERDVDAAVQEWRDGDLVQASQEFAHAADQG